MKDIFSLDKVNQELKFVIHRLEDGELWLMNDFLPFHESQEMFQVLKQRISWQQGEVKLFGKSYLEPRLSAWYGTAGVSYTYAGKSAEAIPWTTLLLEIKQRIETCLSGQTFNSVLLNLYRDGNDKMGWHADNEKELGENPCIASLSLGTCRYFDLKHRYKKHLKLRIELRPGSLLIMRGELQKYWLHQIPAQKRISDARINLTFRNVSC